MILRRFYADNYRCLVNFELKLTSVQLLVGVNGSGKSTVFDAIDALRRLVIDASSCEEAFLAGTRTRWQEVTRQHFELDVESPEGPLYRYTVVIDRGVRHDATVRQETLDFDGKPLFSFLNGEIRLFDDRQAAKPGVVFRADQRHSGLAIVAPRPEENRKLSEFKTWLEQLRPVQIDPWAMSEQSEKETRFPSQDLENLADWFRHLVQENADAVQSAMEDLRDAVPGFRSLNAKTAGHQYREVMAAMESPTGKPVEVTLTELSEGQRCLIALYLLLHAQLSEGGTLIVDEPENFIALREIQPWLMKALTRVEDCHGQLIIASHHPEILDQLVAHGAVVLTRKDGAATRVIPFPESELPPSEVVASGWEDV